MTEVRMAAALLALGIQRKRLISREEFQRIVYLATDSLSKIGAHTDLTQLDIIDRIPADQAIAVVNDTKSRIISEITRACDAQTAALFSLIFSFYLVVTTPEIIDQVGPELTRIASAAELPAAKLAPVLTRAKTDPDGAISDLEAAVDAALGAKQANWMSDWFDTIEIKPGIIGIRFDAKKAISLAAKWIAKRRNAKG